MTAIRDFKRKAKKTALQAFFDRLKVFEHNLHEVATAVRVLEAKVSNLEGPTEQTDSGIITFKK